MECASLARGAAWAATEAAETGTPASRSPTERNRQRLELISYPQRELLVLAHAGAVPAELVVAFEHHVIDRLVRQTEGGDAAGEGVVARDAVGHTGLRVIPLVPDERVEPLGRRRAQCREQVVRPFDITAGNPAPHRFGEGGVDLFD